jgi:hypothetical protein
MKSSYFCKKNEMKIYCTTWFFGILLFCIPQIAVSQSISKENALIAATNFLQARSIQIRIIDAEPFMNQQAQLGWLINCNPQGFIVVSNSMTLPPVLAWSAEGNFEDGNIWETFTPILQHDYSIRFQFAFSDKVELEKNNKFWNELLAFPEQIPTFEQWPPQGWSPTGGWLFTNWTQSAPYNGLCPVDPTTHQRSVAGCPATAMAQILNFHHTINNTRFSDADDYYHNFGSGNQFWIDNDWESRGFPSWPKLNEYLDTLDFHYTNEIPLTNTDKAAITYACGVAARQVYSPSVSGTYGIDQVYDAFVRFGFSDAILMYPSDTSLNTHLAQNVMNALPAHLGLVDPGVTVGHNVVVDGYSSDGFYHFNFGWGGSANGWYTMPPTNIPYNLTVIEGIVLDVNLGNAPVKINDKNQITNPEIRFLQATHSIQIKWPCGEFETVMIDVVDLLGRVILHDLVRFSHENNYTEITLPAQVKGIFILSLKTNSGISVNRKFLIPG